MFRKEFRPAYGNLGLLSNVFPNVPIVAMTATATENMQLKIVENLGMDCPQIIKANPDRPNIYLSCERRGNSKEKRLASILDPLAVELETLCLNTPLTLVYGTLEVVSESYHYLSMKLGHKQYYPLGSKHIAANRLFTQYHAQYPERERNRIVDGLLSGNSVLRVLFVTVAFGIGIDLNNIRRVIHIGVPYSMEEYFQEIGRAGRDGHLASATLYHNSNDVSKRRKAMSDVMRNYVASTNECRRMIILKYFGYSSGVHTFVPLHSCCDYHKSICECDNCCAEMVNQVDSALKDVSLTNSTPQLVDEQIDLERLHDELTSYWLTLDYGRSCIGSTSFSSGFSVELIELVCTSFQELNSFDDVVTKMPVFSKDNAMVIWNILKKYKL